MWHCGLTRHGWIFCWNRPINPPPGWSYLPNFQIQASWLKLIPLNKFILQEISQMLLKTRETRLNLVVCALILRLSGLRRWNSSLCLENHASSAASGLVWTDSCDARRQITDPTTGKALLMNINYAVCALPGNLSGACLAHLINIQWVVYTRCNWENQSACNH